MTITLPTRALNRVRIPDPALAGLLRRVVADRPLWQPLIRFGTAERYWARIPVPEKVDVWLLTWTMSQATELHDHGEAEAAFTVVSGVLNEIRPEQDRLVVHNRRPGSVVSVLPGELHDVRNELSEPAVSIHVYAPRLTTMTYYSFDDGVPRPVRRVLGDEPEQD